MPLSWLLRTANFYSVLSAIWIEKKIYVGIE